MGDYSQPADVASDRIKFSEHIGSLVHFAPKSDTTYDYGDGPEPVVVSEVDVIDGPGSPAAYEGVNVSNDLLYKALSQQIGGRVLGRLVKAGRAVKLDDHTPADAAKADAYFASKNQAPAAPAAPASPAAAPDLSGLTPEQLAAIAAIAANK